MFCYKFLFYKFWNFKSKRHNKIKCIFKDTNRCNCIIRMISVSTRKKQERESRDIDNLLKAEVLCIGKNNLNYFIQMISF